MSRGRRRAVRVLALAMAAALAVLAGCSDDDPGSQQDEPEGSPSTSLYTLTPLPMPPQQPPTGRLIASIEQSSRDGAANRFQIWIDNDTAEAITPTGVTLQDDRFRTAALPATRLREIPSQSRRGFPVYQPDQPACDRTASSGRVTIDYTVDGERRSETVEVEDEADVIERLTSARCLELKIDELADLSWADEVTAEGDGGKGSTGTMFLVIDTSGRPGPTLVIDSIVGNPVLSPGERGVFEANLTIRGDQRSQRVPVPVEPTRCDAHAFGESGSFGAFAFNVHVDGEPGQFVLRMGPTAAANAITYAKASCGFLTSIGGGEG